MFSSSLFYFCLFVVVVCLGFFFEGIVLPSGRNTGPGTEFMALIERILKPSSHLSTNIKHIIYTLFKLRLMKKGTLSPERSHKKK